MNSRKCKHTLLTTLQIDISHHFNAPLGMRQEHRSIFDQQVAWAHSMGLTLAQAFGWKSRGGGKWVYEWLTLCLLSLLRYHSPPWVLFTALSAHEVSLPGLEDKGQVSLLLTCESPDSLPLSLPCAAALWAGVRPLMANLASTLGLFIWHTRRGPGLQRLNCYWEFSLPKVRRSVWEVRENEWGRAAWELQCFLKKSEDNVRVWGGHCPCVKRVIVVERHSFNLCLTVWYTWQQ